MSASRSVHSISRGASRARANKPKMDSSIMTVLSRTVKILSLTMVLGAMGYGIYWVSPRLSWPVEHVVLEGDFRWLDQGAVHLAITENMDGDLLSIDIKKLRQEIRQVPWVEDAEISRVYPDSLVVRINEEKPVARWNDQGYISSMGEFIDSPIYSELSGLPQLSSRLPGIDAAQGAREAIEIYHLLNSAVLVSGENIEVLSQDASGGWTMIWESGLEIDLGRSDHLKRVRHALAAWRRLPDEERKEVGEIDARYDNGVAIRARQSGESGQIATEDKPAGKPSVTAKDNPA